jgi:hypothetical protein
MKYLLCGAILCLGTQAFADSYRNNEAFKPIIAQNSILGCESKDIFLGLSLLAMQGDSVAFTKATNEMVANGSCTVIPKGSAVYMVVPPKDGVMSIREVGELTPYWTVPSMVYGSE